MSQQPEALRLADWIESEAPPTDEASCADVAAELRRLHEAHDWQYKMAGDRLRRIEKLERINHELLAALNDIANTDPVDAALDPQRARRIASAAIAKAEGKDEKA